MVSLRPMTADDLPKVEEWLRLSHVARWWTQDSTPEQEVVTYRQRVAGTSVRPTALLLVTSAGAAIGWCQWYRWADFPDAAVGAESSDVGIDFAIGDPSWTGRGIGTLPVAVLVDEARRHCPGAGAVVVVDAADMASRRMLGKNDFVLADVRPVATKPSSAPMAVYRLTSLEPRPIPRGSTRLGRSTS